MPAVKPGVYPARKCADKALDARQLPDGTAVDFHKCIRQTRLNLAEPHAQLIDFAVCRRGAGLAVRDEKAVHLADAEQLHLLAPVADEAVVAAVGKHKTLDFVCQRRVCVHRHGDGFLRRFINDEIEFHRIPPRSVMSIAQFFRFARIFRQAVGF